SPTAGASPASGAGVSVAVRNGTRTRGLAARAAERLGAAGFTVTDTATAPDQTHPRTVIAYGPGQRAGAEAVATHFPDAELTASTTPGITVTLGRSYADAPSATAPTPSAGTPTGAPTATVPPADTRAADADPCADLSYG
ncbi:LytR C-terminal domain-containing protein, partial [Streptomyces sp. NPDC004787]|uniref:LytR C-terminal domain-containing protein n=1 Tax=Streptomyces sp. NPDC004787 TaxID=3154291 RepID=UPI0033B042A7